MKRGTPWWAVKQQGKLGDASDYKLIYALLAAVIEIADHSRHADPRGI